MGGMAAEKPCLWAGGDLIHLRTATGAEQSLLGGAVVWHRGITLMGVVAWLYCVSWVRSSPFPS